MQQIDCLKTAIGRSPATLWMVLTTVFALPTLLPLLAAAENRAFVVGINTYDNLGAQKQLKNAVNDGNAVSKKLREMGFKVVYASNLPAQSLVEFFGDRSLGSITPADVTAYRAQRVQCKRITCPTCTRIVTRRVCRGCGWKRDDAGVPVSIRTVNHDHMTLTHMFNMARSPQFRLVTDNPAAHVPKPNRRTNATELRPLKNGSD